MQLAIRPMAVGAEVVGLVPGDEQDSAVRKVLYDGWLAHGILLFRDVETTEHHLALSRVFGDLELHPLPFVRAAHEPLLMELGGDRRGQAYVYDETDMRLGRIPWHRDTAYTVDICKGAMLRMLEVPASEGETMVGDTAMAYDDLSPEMKARLDGMEYTTSFHSMDQSWPGAFWRTMRVATEEEDPIGAKAPIRHVKDGPIVVHPVVMTHPESGRKCLFLSPKDSLYFLGMSQSESDDLLRELSTHMRQPRYVYKHSWSVNDALLWDNRRIMHAAAGYKIEDRRWAVRTTLAGSLRTGHYLDANVQDADTPFAMD
jgi:taurine dioxygenase